jgi:sigma-E factor negative regulatory protein RseA
MLNDSESNAAARERLSALLDGESDGAGIAQACAHWRESVEARATWHAYHLIGDVLRSDDLAIEPVRDARLLRAVRARLANEPVVLAPSVGVAMPGPAQKGAAGVRAGRRFLWMAPTAVAAGFVMVAGVVTLTRPGVVADRSPAGSVAQVAAPAALGDARAVAVAPIAEARPFVASSQLIRDARLDRYLAAHQQFAGSTALGVPSAYLRNATTEVPGR